MMHPAAKFHCGARKCDMEMSRKFGRLLIRGLIHAAGESPAPKIGNKEKCFPGLRNRGKTKSKPPPRRALSLVSVPHSG